MKLIAQILSLLLLLHFTASEQIVAQDRQFCTIEGKIRDKSTLEPLEAVNVFLNSTTLGSATDTEGTYIIKNVPVGYFELVISMVGYETKKKFISVDREYMRGLDFNISPVSIEIEQIDVYAERDDDWEEQFELFRDYFIGTSENASRCKIVNKEIIDFKLSSDKTTLKAKAKDRIEILNEALGYRMYVNLMEFNLSRSGETDYLCEAYFQELETTDPVVQYEWEQARKEAYMGSARHFLASLTRHELFEDGFRVFNTGYPSWPQLTKFDYSRPWLEEKVDTVSDWERSLKHNEFVKVVYVVEGEEENYFFYRREQGSTLTSAHHMQTSWFKLPFGYVSFDTTGNIVHESGSMKIWGYWGWKRMADLLPKDYFPTEE